MFCIWKPFSSFFMLLLTFENCRLVEGNFLELCSCVVGKLPSHFSYLAVRHIIIQVLSFLANILAILRYCSHIYHFEEKWSAVLARPTGAIFAYYCVLAKKLSINVVVFQLYSKSHFWYLFIGKMSVVCRFHPTRAILACYCAYIFRKIL